MRRAGILALLALFLAQPAVAQELPPRSVTNANARVIASAGCNFYGGAMLAGATGGYLIALNAASAPAAGATIAAADLLYPPVPVAANTVASVGGGNFPVRGSIGCTLLFSTTPLTNTVPANPAIAIVGRGL